MEKKRDYQNKESRAEKKIVKKDLVRVLDVDNNGNPISMAPEKKAKKTAASAKNTNKKNGKLSGTKPQGKTQAKSSAAKKPLGKDLSAVMKKKPVRKIAEYYYFAEKKLDCRDLLAATGPFDPKSDIWPDLNLMEIVMGYDSLIFQDATECFEDPEDLKWFADQGIQTWYQISYDTGDIEQVRKAMAQIMSVCGGVICSDTDDFQPSYRVGDLDKLV